jgi:hypothetical protein
VEHGQPADARTEDGDRACAWIGRLDGHRSMITDRLAPPSGPSLVTG